jgi:Tol biopolymer transport system component
MKASRVFCFALVLSLALPAFAGRQVTIDDLMKYRNASSVELSPDGSRAVFVVTQPDFDENVMRSNLYLLGASGAAIQLTNGPRHDEHPRWSPDGKWIAFISDRDAKPAKAGKRQVWVISPDGGEAWQLTRGTQTIVAAEWAPDGKHLAVVATEAPSDEEEKRTKDKDDAVIVDHDYKMGRIYLVSVPDGKAELLYAGDRHITSISFSPRGDEIAFADQPTPKLANFYLRSVIGVINVGTKQVRVIAGAPSSNAYPQFSPDGSMVAFLGLLPTDLLAWRLYVVPVTGGASRRVAADVDEEIREFRWADDSAALYFGA